MTTRDWLAAACLAAAALAAGAVADCGRCWGIDHLRHLGDLALPVLAAALALLAVSLLLFRVRAEWTAPRLAAPVLLAAALVALLLAPMRTFFYGDGSILVPQVFRAVNAGAYDAGILLNLKSAPLTGLAVTALVRGIPAVAGTPDDATYPFAGLSVLALAVLALVWFFFLREERDAGLGLLLLLLGSAGAVFFAGYAEYYTLTFVLLAGYLLAGERALRGRGGMAPVLVFYVLLLASHYMALAFLPSLLYLAACRRGGRFQRLTAPRAVASAVAAVLVLWDAAYWALGFGSGDSRIVMPIEPLSVPAGIQRYTLFSGMHLADMANLHALLAPVQLVLLVVLAIRKKDLRASPVFQFHTLAAGFFVLFIFHANTSLGLARDWDIAAPLGAAFSCFTYFLLRERDRIPAARAVSAGLLALAAMLPWQAAMRDTGAAMRRFETVMRLDDRNILGDYALSGYEALRKQYLHDGDLAGELRATRAMVDILGYPAHYELLAEASRQLAAKDSAACARLQAWMLERLERKAGELRARGAARDYSIAMSDIARIAARIRYDAYFLAGPAAFRGETARISAATGDSIPLVMERGVAAYYAGDYAGASRALEPAIRRGLRFEKLYGLLLYALYAQGRPEEARRCYDEGMREHPRSFNIPISYGYAFLLREDVDRAEPLLAFALRQGPPPARAAELQAVLRRIAEYRAAIRR